jgi:hypothetical protein
MRHLTGAERQENVRKEMAKKLETTVYKRVLYNVYVLVDERQLQ